MVKSMTGYGRHESVLHGRTLVIEVKSVNNRYLDCNVRLPRVCICAEDGVQRRVKEVISRGKVDVYVNMENNTEEAVLPSCMRHFPAKKWGMQGCHRKK